MYFLAHGAQERSHLALHSDLQEPQGRATSNLNHPPADQLAPGNRGGGRRPDVRRSLLLRVHLRALQPDDAPPEYRGCLTDAAAGGVSLSFGLFDRDRLVGHLVCCGFKPTLFPGEIGEALHVRHVAVLPRYRRMLPRLVRRFGIEARRHYPGSSIEASAVESALGIWRAHPEFFARDGYAVTRHVDSGEMLDGEIRYLVRWQPIPDWEPEVPTVEQLVAPPRGRAVEVDDTRYETAVVRERRLLGRSQNR